MSSSVIKNTNFELVTEFARTDAKKRLSLGEALAGSSAFNIYRNTFGQLFLDPVRAVPADEAWLSVASSQNLIQAAQAFVSEGDLSPLNKVAKQERVDALADWLGVAEWSNRTRTAFDGALRDPARLTVLAICSPEYLVSA